MIYICKPKKIALYVNTGRKTAAQIKAETGCTALINGGLFNGAFKPVCHLKVDGVVLAKDRYKYWGFGWTSGKADLQMVEDYSRLDNYICCVEMVRDGKPTTPLIYDTALGGSRPRTAIGVYEDGRVWLYAEKAAKTPEQLRDLAVREGLKCAIMLDGGGSTQGICPASTVKSDRIVHNFILVWAEDDNKERDSKMKIYLSPSAQPANSYSAGNTNEQVQCNRIASYAKTALERCGFEVKKAPEGQSYQKNVAESNAWGADLHIPIHTNAGGGYGPIVFVYGRTKARLALANPVYNALCAVVPKANAYGVRENAGLYEVAQTNSTCIYVECEFHDNAALARWIIDNAAVLGEAICKGICEGTGVPYISSEPNTLEARVQALEAWARANGMK